MSAPYWLQFSSPYEVTPATFHWPLWSVNAGPPESPKQVWC